MSGFVENYDLDEIRDSKYAFNTDRIITCKLAFQDYYCYREELIEVGGDIVGYELIGYCIDKLLIESDYEFCIDGEESSLIITEPEDLGTMLVKFEIISVTLKGESL